MRRRDIAAEIRRYMAETGFAPIGGAAILADDTEARCRYRAVKRKRDAVARRNLVVTLGAGFHQRIEELYQSTWGSVGYGPGGAEECGWSNTTRNPHTGAKVPRHWCNAGTRAEKVGRRMMLIIENYRGTEKLRCELPPRNAVVDGDLLRSGDLYGLMRQIAGHTVLVRYGVSSRNRLIRVGYSLLVREKWFRGKKIAECRHAANTAGSFVQGDQP